MKRGNGVFGLIFWAFFSVGTAVLTGCLYAMNPGFGGCYRAGWERLAYAIAEIFYLLLFYRIVGKTFKNRKCYILIVLFPMLYTIRILLLNNLWEYLNFNFYFRWESPISYWQILRNDLAHTERYLFLKYPLVFVGMLILCGLIYYFSRGGGQRLKHRLLRAIYRALTPEPSPEVIQAAQELYDELCREAKEEKNDE